MWKSKKKQDVKAVDKEEVLEEELQAQVDHEEQSWSKQTDSITIYMHHDVAWMYHKGLNKVTKEQLKELGKTSFSYELR